MGQEERLNLQLIGKVFIRGKIEALTGLHIGGSKTALDIGGIDNPVIRDSRSRPYIPGSSLKGKMRCLLERQSGHLDKHTKGPIAAIFGVGAGVKNTVGPTRLYARDAYMDEETAALMESKSGRFRELELRYTESKFENVIDRLTSHSQNLRQTERVPAGAKFDFEIVYTLYHKSDVALLERVITGLELLEDDYLGGHGSRGYGQIRFHYQDVVLKTGKDYEAGTAQNFETEPRRLPGDLVASIKSRLEASR